MRPWTQCEERAGLHSAFDLEFCTISPPPPLPNAAQAWDILLGLMCGVMLAQGVDACGCVPAHPCSLSALSMVYVCRSLFTII